jgi:hypothetical protein
VKKGDKPSIITTTRDCWSTGDTTDEVSTCSDSSIGPELYAVETKTCVCEADNCNGKGAPNAKGTGAPADKTSSAVAGNNYNNWDLIRIIVVMMLTTLNM